MVESTTIGRPLLWKKMPGKPAVKNSSLGLLCSVEFLMVSVPWLLSTTKKTAPPPSRALLRRMTVPAMRTL